MQSDSKALKKKGEKEIILLFEIKKKCARLFAETDSKKSEIHERE